MIEFNSLPSFGDACKGLASDEVSRTVSTWVAMFSRCYLPDNIGFKDYGARGITVCPQWQVFHQFLLDMGSRPEGKTLDRIDFNGDYEPDNCRWATPVEQARNTRRNRVLCIDGREMLLVEASKEFNLDPSTIIRRIDRGLSDSDAVRSECVKKMKLNQYQASVIKRRIKDGEKDHSIAIDFGVSRQLINAVRHGVAWKEVRPLAKSADQLASDGD